MNAPRTLVPVPQTPTTPPPSSPPPKDYPIKIRSINRYIPKIGISQLLIPIIRHQFKSLACPAIAFKGQGDCALGNTNVSFLCKPVHHFVLIEPAGVLELSK
jgi:hypothetical protein